MHDAFSDFSPNLTSPATSAFEVIPSDTNDFPNVSRAIYVGGSGDLRVRMQSGQVVTFIEVSGVLPLRGSRVLETGTTATDIVALY